MIQIFNFSNCRFTYEKDINPFKSLLFLFNGLKQACKTVKDKCKEKN